VTIPEFLKSQKKHSSKYLHLSIGLGLCSGFLIIIQAWLLATIVNAVMFEDAKLTDTKVELAILLLIFITRAALVWASEISAFKAAALVKTHLRQKLQQHLFALGPMGLPQQHSGEISNTLIEGIEALENYYARYLPTMALVALIPLSILVFIFPIDWISGLVLVVTAPLIPFFMILIGKGTERLNKQQWQKLARMSAHFLDMIQGITTLKLFDASKREAKAIGIISDDYRKATMKVLRIAFLSSLALEFLATVSIALVAVLIGFRLYYGEMNFYYGFFALLLAPEFYLPLRNMGTHYHARLEAIGAAENIMEILETPQPPISATSQQFHNEAIDITLKNIQFSYKDRGMALDDFSCHIANNQRTALVGYSGSGKSTIANLLLGFAQADKGNIFINKVPLTEINLVDWRQQIAWVSQRPHIFYGSIRENICVGMQNKSEAALHTAAKNAHIHEFILTLSEGYDTTIGERGAGLSGGQAQRIALARAFLKDAPFVILDEATANLDSESEQLIQKSINKLTKNKTVLIIAHRLSTIENADKILVMNEGKLVEEGSHQNLLSHDSVYNKMIQTLIKNEGLIQ
jgi:ATP-binding cassette subfamily C protein CydD